MKAKAKSRTLWFNAIGGALATLESFVPLLTPYFGSKTMQVVIGVIVVGNILLRLDTREALQ